MWSCPECKRRFGKKNQSHECSPGLLVTEYFESDPEFERPIFEAVLAHLQTLDPEVYFEPVQVGTWLLRQLKATLSIFPSSDLARVCDLPEEKHLAGA